MNQIETKTIKDELKLWESALVDEQQRNDSQQRIWICKGAINALKGLMQELNIKL